MTTPVKIIIGFLLVNFSLVSCRDNSLPEEFFLYPGLELNDTTWDNNTISSVKTDSILKDFAIPIMPRYFFASSGGPFEIASNTRVSFPANSYEQFPSLTPVSGSSQIKAEFVPVYKKADFIRNLRTTVGPKGIYETDAMFSLKLSNTNGTVLLSSGNNYKIEYIPLNVSGNYRYCYEVVSSSNPNNPYSWVEGTQTEGTWETGNVTINGTTTNGYIVKSNKTFRIAINKPYIPSSTARANLVLPVNFTNKNTIVFAVFTNKNIVLRLTPDYVNRNFFYDKMPEGESVNFISISYIDDKYYWGSEIYTTNRGLPKYKISPGINPVSVNEIISVLNNL